ncbi:hypothetical protein R3P38DRAFT_2780589 [Favolaschia claudopus]|uniref:Uncharacterized protein n=1 Tax=Favolaschia claudopus TaxID=2862362 RepID=A0AAW0BAG9_9AGAR
MSQCQFFKLPLLVPRAESSISALTSATAPRGIGACFAAYISQEFGWQLVLAPRHRQPTASRCILFTLLPFITLEIDIASVLCPPFTTSTRPACSSAFFFVLRQEWDAESILTLARSSLWLIMLGDCAAVTFAHFGERFVECVRTGVVDAGSEDREPGGSRLGTLSGLGSRGSSLSISTRLVGFAEALMMSLSYLYSGVIATYIALSCLVEIVLAVFAAKLVVCGGVHTRTRICGSQMLAHGSELMSPSRCVLVARGGNIMKPAHSSSRAPFNIVWERRSFSDRACDNTYLSLKVSYRSLRTPMDDGGTKKSSDDYVASLSYKHWWITEVMPGGVAGYHAGHNEEGLTQVSKFKTDRPPDTIHLVILSRASNPLFTLTVGGGLDSRSPRLISPFGDLPVGVYGRNIVGTQRGQFDWNFREFIPLQRDKISRRREASRRPEVTMESIMKAWWRASGALPSPTRGMVIGGGEPEENPTLMGWWGSSGSPTKLELPAAPSVRRLPLCVGLYVEAGYRDDVVVPP